jgi:phage-related protein
VADKIKSFLHFSVPDEGPLTDFQSWMPDFMGGLAEGIGDSEDTLLDKVKGVASGISTLMQGATANVSTAASGAVSNTSNTTVTQNNTFNNSYSGSDTQAQKNVSKGMNKSAQDATTYMAKGLAYAR